MPRSRRPSRGRRSLLALLVVVLAGGIALAATLGEHPRPVPRAVKAPPAAPRRAARHPRPPRRFPRSRAAVPILMYHVIAPPPPTAPYPGLYVPAPEFAAQMRALARAGFHGVTQDAVRRAWLGHGALPPHPIVVTFDNGYRTQYTEAFPVLQRLGWPAVENLQLEGLPPSQGGILPREVRRMLRAGWELDTQGMSHADLPVLDAASLRFQVDAARRAIVRLYGVSPHWFCYPSGRYDARVVAAIRADGFVGSTTVVPGWATPADDPFALPRLRVLGGTSPAALLAQIGAARLDPRPPASY